MAANLVRVARSAARLPISSRASAATFSTKSDSLDWNAFTNYFDNPKTKESLQELRKVHIQSQAALSSHSSKAAEGLPKIDWAEWENAIVLEAFQNIELGGKKTNVVQYLKEQYEALDKKIREDEVKRRADFQKEVAAFDAMKTTAITQFQAAEKQLRENIKDLEADIDWIKETARRYPDGYKDVDELLERYPLEVQEKMQFHFDRNQWDIFWNRETPLDKYDAEWKAHKEGGHAAHH
eukprot:TRINITY_DN2005_c0_g1::TRINITY_DN2005_c0_g1_i1::g.21953::m.21953 TRINITY_DN2005_c0_g1::TRINITY_DN2005_c0_g1_i1::g.21953  ORF type:complete len:250 (-),score=92.12,Mt_ATP-synt_D/PF05873.7/0.00016,T2SG/PF08334.6/7.8e+02,T2SG/PF08334.6/0.017,SYF2/PF08231.7/7.5e+02,SYF2/PF08231.7/0.16,Filament/PF00038.16/72,Filament/PF00038.16/0.17,DivIC/PF04977.10/3.9e+02,DivIC/PF04977.10/0.51 TRINITY_DN2005_c0_g1_i1:87-800(-)